MIEALLLQMTLATDSNGTPLLSQVGLIGQYYEIDDVEYHDIINIEEIFQFFNFPYSQEMTSILEEQKKHLLCLQDPTGIRYTL